MAGAEKPLPPRDTPQAPHVQQCRWEAACNRILMLVIQDKKGVGNIAAMVGYKGQMAGRLRTLYGNEDAPVDDWRRISRDGYLWLHGKAA